MTSAEAAKAADIIMILINDEKQAQLYKESIEPNLCEGKTLAFAHGFNIHFGCIKPPKNVNIPPVSFYKKKMLENSHFCGFQAVNLNITF